MSSTSVTVRLGAHMPSTLGTPCVQNTCHQQDEVSAVAFKGLVLSLSLMGRGMNSAASPVPWQPEGGSVKRGHQASWPGNPCTAVPALHRVA
jgi:hypothetical protein